MNRAHFTPPFSPGAMPAWRCPHCPDGALASVRDTLKQYETAKSRASSAYPDWDRAWDVRRFFMLMKCVNCDGPVLCIGKIESIEGHSEEHGGVCWDVVVPTYVEPTVPVMAIPEICPEAVREEVLNASAWVWCSPSSAGNTMRAAVERLMDALGVASAGSLQARIQAYVAKNQDVADKLLAMKGIAHAGGHADPLDLSDALDAFEILECCLESIYEGRSARLESLAAAIPPAAPPPK